MPKAVRPYYERFASDMILIYIGGALLVVGPFVFSEYTQGWTWSLTSPSIWALIGYTVFATGIVIWGMIAAFRQKTKKLFSGNYLFELSHPDPMHVITHHYQVNQNALETVLPESARQDIEAALRTPPGTDGKGFDVPVEVLEPGGVSAYGFTSLEGGGQGFVITRGHTQVIRLGIGTFIPHDLIPLDHSKVHPDVLTYLKANRQSFKDHSSRIFEVGPLNSGVENWLMGSPSAQSAVLRGIGYENLPALFVARLEKMLYTLKTPEAERFRKAFAGDLRGTLALAVKQWLDQQPALQLAVGNGEAGLDYWRSLALSYLSELTLANSRLELKNDTIHVQEHRENAVARKRARIAGSPLSGSPAYDLASRPPMESE